MYSQYECLIVNRSKTILDPLRCLRSFALQGINQLLLALPMFAPAVIASQVV